MRTPTDFELTEDFLPACRALVAERRTVVAGGWLIFWGAIDVLYWLPLLLAGQDRPMPGATDEPGSIVHVTLVLGAVLMAAGIYAVVAKPLWAVMIEGYVLTCFGVYSFVCAAILLVTRSDVREMVVLFIVALIQLGLGVRSLKCARMLRRWREQAADTPIETMEGLEAILKSLAHDKAVPTEGRLQARVSAGDPFSIFQPHMFRGWFVGENVVFVSVRRFEIHEFARDTIATRKISPIGRHFQGDLKTAFGGRRYRFDVLSGLAIKRWVDEPLTAKDLRALEGSQKVLTAPLIGDLLGYVHEPELRVRLLKMLRKLKPAMAAGAGELAAGIVRQAEPALLPTAMSLAATFHEPGLDAEAVAALDSPDADLRRAAAEYLSAFPSPQLVDRLRHLAEVEPDRAARKALRRALEACQTGTFGRA